MNTHLGDTIRAAVRGQVIQPGDPAYDEARAVHNGMIDRHPALVVRCASTDDVVSAIRIGHDHQLPVAIRGGGHSAPGFGTCDGGVVVDLGALREVHVDTANGTVRVGGGATWGDVDRATAPHGLSVPGGIISSTGVGGLTLGGGHGYLTRKYGLTIDNLRAAEVVLADGRVVTADATREPDLFWALRGGGGNFGAVTAFTFTARPVGTIIGGPMLWSWDDLPAMMRFFADHLPGLPDDIYGFFGELIVPPGPPFPEPLHLSKACAIVWCSLAGPDETAALIEPFRRFRTPIVDFVGPMPMPALNSMFDVLYPKGTRSYWKGDFFDGITDEMIPLHEKHGRALPSVQSTMHLYPVDGAASRVGADDTAWAYRNARYSQVIVGADMNPASDATFTSWARDYWLALHPHSAGGAYVNFLMGDEGQERIRGTYRGHYDRLAAIKRTYDPDNVFRVNQNITPA
jgi:FAD/FMN-containing dehydrogenase